MDVVRVLAEAGGFQVVFDPGLSCRLTMKVTGARWRSVLDTTLSACGLGREEEGNVLRVATLSRLGPGPSGAAYPGYGDSYGYPPPGYGASSADAYRDSYRGRVAPPSYGGYVEPYPDYGSAGGYPPDAYAPPPGYYSQPPRATVKP